MDTINHQDLDTADNAPGLSDPGNVQERKARIPPDVPVTPNWTLLTAEFTTRYAESLGMATDKDSYFHKWQSKNIDSITNVLTSCIEKQSFQALLELMAPQSFYNREFLNAPSIIDSVVRISWTYPYRGSSHLGLLDSILRENRTSAPGYGNFGALLQPSGYGKSRTVDELAKLVVSIPMNLRDPNRDLIGGGAFPLGDKDLYRALEYLSRDTGTLDAVISKATRRFHRLFRIVFQRVASLIRQLQEDLLVKPSGTDPAELALAWRARLMINGTRQKLFSGLEEELRTDTSSESTDPEIEAREALMKLLGLVPAIRCGDNELKIVIYIESMALLTDVGPGRDLKLYDIMIEALAAYADLPLFVLFVSNEVKRVRRPYFSDYGHRRETIAGNLLPLYTGLPFDCDPSFDQPIQPGTLKLADLQNLRFVFRFCRPLWWTLCDGYVYNSEASYNAWTVLSLARAKLLHDPGKTAITRTAGRFAVLDVLLNLEYDASHPETETLMEELVSSHMRTLFSMDGRRKHLASGYPSEPALAEAAMQIIDDIERKRATEYYSRNDRDYLAEIFREAVEGNEDMVKTEYRNGLVGRLLLLRAYMAATRSDSTRDLSYSNTFHRGCSLLTFLECLFPETYHERLRCCLPDNLQGHEELRDVFKDAWVRFTHFARVEGAKCFSTAMAWGAFIRGMAVIDIEDDNGFVDVMIPILLRKSAAVAEWVMSGILVRFQRQWTHGMPTWSAVDEADIPFFPSRYEQARRAPKATPEEIEEVIRRPYISLVLDLGPPDPPLHAPKVEQTFIRLVPKTATRRRSRSAHPRYSFFACGCSPAVFRPRKECDRHNYRALLTWTPEERLLNEHPRPDMVGLVRAMKPFWMSGPECFSWIDSTHLPNRLNTRSLDPSVAFEDTVIIGAASVTVEDKQRDSGPEKPSGGSQELEM